jgi:hypothetical protein
MYLEVQIHCWVFPMVQYRFESKMWNLKKRRVDVGLSCCISSGAVSRRVEKVVFPMVP